MKTQMYYCIAKTAQLVEVLEAYKIKYKTFEMRANEPYVTFYVFKEDEAWTQLEKILPPKPAHGLVFNDEELLNAKWLKLRSTCMKIDSRNPDTFSYICPKNPESPKINKYHQTQVLPFSFSSVKWSNNNHFYSTYEGGYEMIFCDDFAKTFLLENRLRGLEFRNVIWHKKGCVLPNVYQMFFKNELPREAIIPDSRAKEIRCPYCGKIQYFCYNDARLGIKEEYLSEDVDFYITPEMFGEVGVYAIPIVSSRVYTALKNAGMTRNLNFEPVVLF